MEAGQKPYNLSKLLAFILRHTKKEKRIAFAPNINQKKEMWEKDDRLEDYQEEVEKSLLESFVDVVKAGAEVVWEIGKGLHIWQVIFLNLGNGFKE